MIGSTAAVERGPSEGARSGSTEPTWVPFFTSWLLLAANSSLCVCRSRSRRADSDLYVWGLA